MPDFENPDDVHTPATGLIIPAAWGAIVNAQLNFLGDTRPRARVALSGTFPHTSSGAWQAIQWNVEERDIGGCFNLSQPSRLVAPIDGDYDVQCNFKWNANTTGRRVARFLRNGVDPSGETEMMVDPTTGGSSVCMAAAFMTFSAGDYIEVQGFQQSGGTLNFQSGEFSIRWVGTGP